MVPAKRNLVVIDDDHLFCDTVSHAFMDMKIQVSTAQTGREGLRLCTEMPVDVVLLDQQLPDANGIDFCAPILDCHERTKIIFITAYPSFENAVHAIKVGAYDYLSKPFEMGELQLAVKNALHTLDLEHHEQVRHYQQKQERQRTILIGAKGGLSEVHHLVQLAATNDAPVLITGETGTGKTMVAKAIHYTSSKAGQPFIPINCAAIPENLIEAELFGFEKGAFTGAVKSGKGLFEMARGGTLFLDEIGEMPTHLQSKLLGVLDGQGFKPLGGHAFQSVDTRIIAATNADLPHLISDKRFREDLYYRLSVMHIHVPPLRKRLADLPHLCRYLLSRLAPERHIDIPPSEIEALQAYHWPGNVRELRNIIERGILVEQGMHLYPSHFLNPHAIRCAHAPSQPPPGGIKPLHVMEQEHIRMALCHFEFNHTHTAKALGISRSTLMRKIKNYRLE